MLQAYQLLFVTCFIICLQGGVVYGGPTCGERDVCDSLNKLQNEVEVSTVQLTKWNNHYDFVQSLHNNFRGEVADIVQEVIAKKPESNPSEPSTDEIMERLKTLEETVASMRSRQMDNVVSAMRLEDEPDDSYFDATFTLQHVLGSSRVITCYSDKNYKNIEFLRVPASQVRERLPSSFTYDKNPIEKYARVEIPAEVKFGAYECKFDAEQGPMSILFVKQFHVEDLQPVERFQIVNVGDTVKFEITKYNLFDHRILWKHNGVAVPAWDGLMKVEIPNVKLNDSGFYEGHYEWRRGNDDNTFMRLVVRKCKANMYGKNCDQVCPVCYNGGVCQDYIGICVCPAGFTGTNCEKACPGGYFGVNCTKPCDDEGEEGCKGHLFCKPDPLGCACASGFKEYNCQESCEPGRYGADCKQPCRCAKGNGACNRFTGACAGGCSPGWRGESCQIEEF